MLSAAVSAASRQRPVHCGAITARGGVGGLEMECRGRHGQQRRPPAAVVHRVTTGDARIPGQRPTDPPGVILSLSYDQLSAASLIGRNAVT